jgi:hypothetical protein
MLSFQDTEIDTERKACYLMKIETGSSLKYELDSLKMLVSSRFGEKQQLVA